MLNITKINKRPVFIGGIALVISFVLSMGPILGNYNALAKSSSNKDYIRFLDCMLISKSLVITTSITVSLA